MKNESDYIPEYMISDVALEELQLLLSRWATDAVKVNEPTMHAFFVRHPEVVSSWLNAGQTLFIRQEPTVDHLRPDCLVWFYGASSYDILEFKWVNEPLMNAKGELTDYCHEAIERLLRNRNDVMAGRCRILDTPPDYTPRIILIGTSSRNPGLPEDEAEKLNRAVRSSKWMEHHRQGALIVTSWQTLAVMTRKIVGRSRNNITNDAATARLKRTRNYFARRILAGSFQLERRQPARIEALQKHIIEIPMLLSHHYLNDSNAGNSEIIRTLALNKARGLAALELLHGQILHEEEMAALLLLSDILGYTNDGDLPCGQWEHGATYRLRDILVKRTDLHEEVSRKLTSIVRLDNNGNAIGIATHIARSMPRVIADLWQSDAELSRRWTFVGIDGLLDKGSRGLVVPHLHVGYASAAHGNDQAVKFMNMCAANNGVVRDVATWHRFHAARDPEKLYKSLEEKDKNPQPELRPFHEWHKRIHWATQVIR